ELSHVRRHELGQRLVVFPRLVESQGQPVTEPLKRAMVSGDAAGEAGEILGVVEYAGVECLGRGLQEPAGRRFGQDRKTVESIEQDAVAVVHAQVVLRLYV